MSKKPLGIYIHIPFCERKCHYCGFLSFAGETPVSRQEFTTALCSELAMYGREIGGGYEVDTVFIGGGTPTLLSADLTGEILETVAGEFSLAAEQEITIEANPNSLTREHVRAFRSQGINRVSMGVQSFDDRILSTLGRIHTAAEALDRYEMLRGEGCCDINIDLIFGVPGQTGGQWEADLRTAADLQPEHISFYSLQLEPGTAFYEQYRKDEIDLPDDDEERGMYHRAVRVFGQHGYEHYEISNCARPGHRCRHNEKYWSLQDYLGLGPGASSYLRGSRFRDCGSLETWYNDIEVKHIMPVDMKSYHTDSRGDAMGVYCFTALRTCEGIDLNDFEKTFGCNFYKAYRDIAEVLIGYKNEGLLSIGSSCIKLTEKGIDRSNEIMSEFV